MRRPDLDGLPALALPPRCEVRVAVPADEAGLARVLARAFETEWTVDRVRRDLTRAPDVAAVYIAMREGEPAATASARRMPGRYPGSGYLHWVASDPAARGLGLGAAVVVRVLERFREEGYGDSVLETDDPRLPAIRLYLRLGYVPEHVDPSHPERWGEVLRSLGPPWDGQE